MPEGDAVPTIVIDRELCMGSGMCIVYAPATFAHDDETKAVVVDPQGDPIAAIQNAVQACPTSAIKLVTDDNDENDDGDHREGA
jgi:ferredoxin